MTEYCVVKQDITSVFSRDVGKATAGLAAQVNELMAQGWRPQGGLATVEAGGDIFLLQAMIRVTTSQG